jgi:uncharacterized protein (TIGR02246 family)
MSEDEKAIRQLVETWIDATRAGNTDRILSLMADDAIFMVPGREPFGKETFGAASNGQKGLRIEGKSDIRELKILGDWAYMRSHLEMAITKPDGKTMRRSGHALTILRKIAPGRWVLSRDANLLTEMT